MSTEFQVDLPPSGLEAPRPNAALWPVRNFSQLRLCFLAGHLGQGGAERQLFYILRALCHQGIIPRLFSLRQNEFWEKSFRDLGVSVQPLGGGHSKLRRLFRLTARLRRESPAIIQSQHFYTNAYAGLAARMLGLVSIGALRSNGVMEVRDCGPAAGWLSLHTPHLLAGNSAVALRYANGHGVAVARLFHLTNVIDTAVFRPAMARSPGPVRLLSMGRLIPSKRFDRFITLVARLRQEGFEVQGTIVGDGPLKGALQAQALGLRLPPPALELPGAAAEAAPLYRLADVFVMTSEYEGTPNVLLEAMASALPVVATPVGGVPALVRDGQTGFLVDGADEAGLCQVLKRLAKEPELRSLMGRRGRAFVAAHHSLNRLPRLLDDLYALALSMSPVRSFSRPVLSHAR